MTDLSASYNTVRSQNGAMYSRNPYSSHGASPPHQSFRSDIFGQSNGSAQTYSTSPVSERHASDRPGATPHLAASTSDPSVFAMDTRPAPAIVIRRLPRNIGNEALMSMLIFAGDLIDTELIRSPYQDDQGYATAVARFRSQAGAIEAQQKLNGKPNTTKETNMIVEIHSNSMVGSLERRATIDGTASRNQTSSSSSAGSTGPLGGPPGRSRYGSTFQSSDKISPPLTTSSSAASAEFPMPETNAHFQNLFSPQSPLVNGCEQRHRVSGKSVINDDAVDDETGELLKDPVAYAKSGQQPVQRRTTNPQLPVSRFGSLSLSTSNGGSMSPSNGFTSPRGAPSMQSPATSMSPTGNGPNSSFNSYPRPQYPPVNPADQNPPCNTLYVGNLPIDTSEDELKAVFSKQRGYKRLCFRTKQNGPMCFVEFEDVSFATKALNDLYGHPLHNSVKGGIRLSFSKNPLGVRSGQAGVMGIGPNGIMSPQAMAPGYGGGVVPGTNFSSVSGPPPGLASPPGLMNNGGYRSQPAPTGMDGMFANPFGMTAQSFNDQLSQRAPAMSGGIPPSMSSATYGRDNRAGYSDYMLGR